MSAVSRVLAGTFIVLAGAAALLFYIPELQSFLSGRDSLAYHLAARMYLEGANPYDPALLRGWQMGLGYPLTAATLYYHYPPAALIPSLGFALFTYETAITLWFLCNVLLLCIGAALLTFSQPGSSSRFTPALLLVLLFFPHLDLLFEGQVAALLFCGVALLSWSLTRGRYFVAGMALSFSLLKPHLMVLLLLVIFIGTVRERRWTLCVGFCALPALLSILAEVLFPGIHMLWLKSFAGLPPFPRTAALVSSLGSWQFAVLASLLVSIGTALLFFRRLQMQELLPWIPLLVTLSVLFSPRVWVSDLSLLAVVPVAAYTALSGSRSAATQLLFCAGWLLVQFGALLLVLMTGMRFAEEFYWFPLLPLLIAAVPIHTKRQKKAGASSGF